MSDYTGWNTQHTKNLAQRLIHIKTTPEPDDIPANLFSLPAGSHGEFICPEAVAWKTVTVWGDMDGATLKFRVKPAITAGAPVPWNDFPGATGESIPANIYPVAGITAAGIYVFEHVIGNLFGNFSWEGAGEDADFWAYVSFQMV